MLDNIKNNLFTISGLITSLIHCLIVVGILCSWMFFNVQVLGNEVAFSVPDYENFVGESPKKRK